MRTIILTAVLGLGSLGLLGALPTEAKAQYMNRFTVGAYSTATYVGRPGYSYYANPVYGAGVSYMSPAAMQYYSNPSGFGMAYRTRGYVGVSYNAFGANYYLSMPGVAGYSYSPYTGYQSYAIPGQVISAPAGGALGYYNSYVPGGYVLP